MPEDFIPPQNLEAEQQVLGAVLLDNAALATIPEILPSDFYRPAHGAALKTMRGLAERREPIDLLSMQASGVDAKYLAEIVSGMVTAANVRYHAKLVKEASNRRQIIRMCREAIQGIAERSVDETLTLIRNGAQGIVSGRGGTIVSMKDVAKDIVGYVEMRRQHRDQISGIPSGFTDIDQITDGWQKGDFIIVAARPGKGKSALAMAMAQNSGVPVGMISLEMGPHQLGIRSLSSLSQVELWRLRKGFFGDGDWGSLVDAFGRMAEMEIYFTFTARNTAEIERAVSQMVEVHGVELLIVDYLQLAKSLEAKKREQEVAEVSRLCKALALTHNMPVMALAQLNRDSEKEKRSPVLADLRESGQIEQDADVVIFLHNDPKRPENVLDILFAKGRNIGLGTARLLFERDTMTFRDYREDDGI